MRIALYGTNKEKLKENKESLYKNIIAVDEQIEITCYDDEELLKNNLKDYHIVFMEEAVLKKFEDFISGNLNRKKITLAVGKEIGTFFVDDIYYVEAELSRIHLITKDGEFLLPVTITQAEKVLEEEGFVKVHRSYLVNANHVVRIKHRTAFMDNGKEIPISKYRLKEVKDKIARI